MHEYRLSIWVGNRRVERVANLLRQAGVHVESTEEDEVILSRQGARPSDAAADVRLALLREFKTHFDLKPVVLGTTEPAAPA